MKHQEIYIRNGFVSVPENTSADEVVYPIQIATMLSNMAYYGYGVDANAYNAIAMMSEQDMTKWYEATKAAIETVTGDDRNIGEYIVYKNFPREVLDMEEGEWVIRQILIYFGMPVDFLREVEEERAPLGDISRLKILGLAAPTIDADLARDLIAMPNRWNDNQTDWARALISGPVTISDYAHSENGVLLAKERFGKDEIKISTATGVLRLAAALSDQDTSLRKRVAFRKFSRPERRILLSMLEQTSNIEADFAARPELSKRLLERLRPGDYKFERVQAAYDDLYNGRTQSFNAKADPQVPTLDTLRTVATRPGELLRRFHHMHDLFGFEAAKAILAPLGSFTTRQLVGFRAYLQSINGRKTLMYPPKADWGKAQIVQNGKKPIPEETISWLDRRIGDHLAGRASMICPEGIDLSADTARIKLQTNDQKLAEYGRGTSFDIPEGMNFVRSASYWQHDRIGVTWYDNGWNFFDENWKSQGGVSWDEQFYGRDAAVFSGDPVNISNMEKKGAQMADLYLDRLAAQGTRYAVWSILCYSREKFSTAIEVLATLQWGENAEEGKTYEPSRAQMVFPLKSEEYTSYVAYIDIKERKLVYMDAPLRSIVSSASENGKILEEIMPAYVEYLDALPSVHDLLRDVPKGPTPILFHDRDQQIDGGKAFVFRPENVENTFDRLTVSNFIS